MSKIKLFRYYEIATVTGYTEAEALLDRAEASAGDYLFMYLHGNGGGDDWKLKSSARELHKLYLEIPEAFYIDCPFNATTPQAPAIEVTTLVLFDNVVLVDGLSYDEARYLLDAANRNLAANYLLFSLRQHESYWGLQSVSKAVTEAFLKAPKKFFIDR